MGARRELPRKLKEVDAAECDAYLVGLVAGNRASDTGGPAMCVHQTEFWRWLDWYDEPGFESQADRRGREVALLPEDSPHLTDDGCAGISGRGRAVAEDVLTHFPWSLRWPICGERGTVDNAEAASIVRAALGTGEGVLGRRRSPPETALGWGRTVN